MRRYASLPATSGTDPSRDWTDCTRYNVSMRRFRPSAPSVGLSTQAASPSVATSPTRRNSRKGDRLDMDDSLMQDICHLNEARDLLFEKQIPRFPEDENVASGRQTAQIMR